MFVLTAKLSKPKLIAFGIILAAILLLVVILLVVKPGTEDPVDQVTAGETNEERAAFLAARGWSIDAEPQEVQKVRIPEVSNDPVFARYNELQLNQGFDLTKYAGEEVTRYVYEVLNYPGAQGPVYASILVCRGSIIGGDITDSSPQGLMHGFRLPSASEESVPETASDPVPREEPTEASAPSRSPS